MQLQAKKLKLVNQGSNSEIYRYGDVQKGVVLKMEARHLANEYNFLSTLNHQNIIKALKYKQRINLQGTGSNKQFETSRNVLVIQNACHGTLLNFYKKSRPTQNQIRWIFAQICEAVRYLHCNYIVHRDIKLENVLVFQNESQIQIKMADFGYASSTKTSHFSKDYKGTPRGFMAPQIHKIFKGSQCQYNMYKTDIFALGVILFTLVLGTLPFEYAIPQNSHYRQISKENYGDFWKMHSHTLSKFSQSNLQDFKQVFQQMVQQEASKRPTIQQVLECSWLKGKQEIIKNISKLPESSTKN